MVCVCVCVELKTSTPNSLFSHTTHTHTHTHRSPKCAYTSPNSQNHTSLHPDHQSTHTHTHTLSHHTTTLTKAWVYILPLHHCSSVSFLQGKADELGEQPLGARESGLLTYTSGQCSTLSSCQHTHWSPHTLSLSSHPHNLLTSIPNFHTHSLSESGLLTYQWPVWGELYSPVSLYTLTGLTPSPLSYLN